jgi:DNA-binding transcriptional MocR family regulator
MKPIFASRMQRIKPSAIRELLRLGADPSVLSFGGGYPDATLFPTEALARAFQTAILRDGETALQYTVSNGLPRLRQQISDRMASDGVACSAENVLVLQGSQQGLDLVGKMLIDKGDVVITESPTFLGALLAFDPFEPRYVGVPMDHEGMDMEALDVALRANQGARLLYTVPDFQNPTGVTMSLPRRRRLIALANAFNLIVVEDTPYRPLRFEGEPIPTLKSLDTEGRVIFLGSFSKILAPGLRLGWAVASDDLIQKLGLLKLAADTQCSTLNMSAVSLLLEDFDIDGHVAQINQTYRRKKILMLDTIRQCFPQSVSTTDPSGGLFTWVTFPEGFDSAAFMADHALPEARVAYVPGATFFPNTQQANHARLNYSGPSDAVITQGMTALGELLKRHG